MSLRPMMGMVGALALGALVAVALAVVATQSGCGTPSYQCTLIGCSDGLQLRILRPNGQPASDFGGTATWDGEPRTFQCSSSPGFGESFNCSGHVITFGTQVPPRELLLRIDPLADGTRFEGTVALPEPVLTQPNGPGCAPTCQFASADVTLQAP